MTPTVLTRAASCVAVLALVFPLTACGQGTDELTAATRATAVQSADASAPASKASKALKKYVEAVQPQIPSMMKGFGDLYSDFTITGVDTGTMVYEYTFTRHVNAAAGAKSLKAYTPTLKVACDTQILPEMKRAGIDSPKVRFSYLNADGSKIWSHTFASK